MKRILPAAALIVLLICACSVTPSPTPDINAILESGAATQIAFLRLVATVNAQGTQIALLSQATETPTAYPTETLYMTPVPFEAGVETDFSKAIANELRLVGTEIYVFTEYNDGQTAMGKYSHYGAEYAEGWWFAINDNSSQWVLTYVSQGEKALCSQVEWLHSRTTYPFFQIYSTGCIP